MADRSKDNKIVLDPELEIYRSVLETPTEFNNGFTWVAVAGAFFCGLLLSHAVDRCRQSGSERTRTGA